MTRLFFATVFAIIYGLAVQAGDIEISTPHSFETPTSAKTGVGYMTITNNGDTVDRLISIKTDFAHAHLHQSKENADGVMQMLAVNDGVEILPGQTVSFKPGGLHVMFMRLKKPLVVGETAKTILVFEKAGEIEVGFDVIKRGSAN